MKQINKLKEKLENYKKVKSTLDYLLELNEILYSEIEQNGNTQLEKDDISIILANSVDDEICSEIKELISTTDLLEKDIDKLEINTLLSGKYDYNNAILTLHPGAGGTEAQDWVQMLYRMYTRWANANNYEVKELDYLPGDEAGIKSVTFLVSRRICIWTFKRRNGSSSIG